MSLTASKTPYSGARPVKPLTWCSEYTSQLDTDLKKLLDRHPDLENASEAMPGTYSIKIDPTAKPVVHGPRKQPAALLPKIVDRLKEMEKEGNLAKVMQPTDWVNAMIVSS